ncbi:MAG TPA: porin [Stellaceae bacterium]|jgi:phosphate-selective porin OprO/OprP|nr:porin [Stellaceae bacterium]
MPKILRGGLVAVAAMIVPLAAAAQTAPADRIDAIEQQIKVLQGQLQTLKRELGDTKEKLRQSQSEAQHAKAQAQQATQAAAQAQNQSQASAIQAQAAAQAAAHPALAATPPPGPHVVQTPGNRFGIESADGQNSIYLTGRLHFDMGDYLDYHPASKFASVQDLNSGVNARRARLGVTGKFAGDWAYTLIYDFGGSTDSSPGANGSGIQSALITYNGLNKGPYPVAFDLGYMDTPFTLDEATSSNDIMFVERPSIQAVASNIFANDFRSAVGVRSNDDRYWAGVYATGPQSGATHNTGEQFGAFGRATYQVLSAPDYSLHLGADIGGLLKPPSVSGIRTITLSDRPELRIDPTAILTTGALGTAANPVTGAAVYGVELAGGWENFFAQGEYYHVDVDRSHLSSNGFDGGYFEASWTITGEHRKYIPAAGAYSGIIPDHPFSPWSDDYGLGAFELAARYSTINLNDHFRPGFAPPPGSNAVGGGNQTIYQVGLNWYPNANMRFMFDYLHGDIIKQFSTAAGGGIAGTPLGANVGGTMDALVLRSQFAF